MSRLSGIPIIQEKKYKKIDDHKKVFVIENDSDLCGYVYIEGNPKYKEGNFEFIAVLLINGIKESELDLSEVDFIFFLLNRRLKKSQFVSKHE